MNRPVDQCPDCMKDGKLTVPIYDVKYEGWVCDRCKRVFKEGFNPLNFHYVDEVSFRRKAERDKKARAQQSMSRQDPWILETTNRILSGR